MKVGSGWGGKKAHKRKKKHEMLQSFDPVARATPARPPRLKAAAAHYQAHFGKRRCLKTKGASPGVLPCEPKGDGMRRVNMRSMGEGGGGLTTLPFWLTRAQPRWVSSAGSLQGDDAAHGSRMV